MKVSGKRTVVRADVPLAATITTVVLTSDPFVAWIARKVIIAVRTPTNTCGALALKSRIIQHTAAGAECAGCLRVAGIAAAAPNVTDAATPTQS